MLLSSRRVETYAIFDLRSRFLRSHADPSRLCCISVDASWQGKYNETTFISLALFNRELLAKTSWWPRVTPDDLYEDQRPKFASDHQQWCNSIHAKITGPDTHRMDLFFSHCLKMGRSQKWPDLMSLKSKNRYIRFVATDGLMISWKFYIDRYKAVAATC